MIFTLLAMSSNELVCGMHASLSELDNVMMENGTFAYNSLSEKNKAALFKDFEIRYPHKVITTISELN